MKSLFGLSLRLFLGLLAAMGLIRVMGKERSPATLAGLTLLATAVAYVGVFPRPRERALAPVGQQVHGKAAREESKP